MIERATSAKLKVITGLDAGVDLNEAKRFLAALAPGETEFAWQTFDDSPDRDEENDKLTAEFHCTLKGATTALTRANGQGAGVFVALNETDGHGRKKKNVVKVRALFLDLDGAPLDPVNECALQPHIVTETSPGKFHVFWRVEDLPLKKFEDLQRALAKRFDGDPAVATLERCTRLPGFFHCKRSDQRFLVRIVEIKTHPAFTTEEVVREFPPQKQPHKTAGSNRRAAPNGEVDDQLILPAGAPLVAAEEFIKHCRARGDLPLLRCYRGAFYLWTGTHYSEYPDESLERDLYAFLKGVLAETNRGVGPYNPTKHKVSEIVHALRCGVLVPREWDAPFWLEQGEYKPAGDLVACRNGILNLETRELVSHDPLLFTPNCLPLDYNPKAAEPERFLEFLADLFPADREGNWDKEAERTLLEIFGYLLTSDTKQHKIFLIVGPPRSGKGTVVFLLEQLLGKDNITYQTLSSMSGDFGRWPLIDKKLCAVTDARLDTRAGLAETLLSISGGDPQTINRKNQAFWNGRLTVRFLITTNELPAIHDASGTIATRFVPIRLTESFLDREDLGLQAKLIPELPGILNLALDSLARLRRRGYFKIPSSSLDSIRELQDLASPVGAFVREWCVVEAGHSVNVKELYRAYRAWAEETGHKASPRHVFGKALRSVVPKLRYTGKGAERRYLGVALSEQGQEVWDELLAEKGRR